MFKKMLNSLIAVGLGFVLGLAACNMPATSAEPAPVVSAFIQPLEGSVYVNTTRGSGSGFVVADGVVVTARHVVEGITGAYIVSNSGVMSIVTGIYLSDEHDIAVLEIFGPNPPSVGLAKSDSLLVGDDVYTIGCPYGVPFLKQLVTYGRIGGLGRIVPGIGENVIVSDTPVAPGNSGGPLFNTDGEVVGITVAMMGPGNISFALPVSQIKEVIELWQSKQLKNVLDAF